MRVYAKSSPERLQFLGNADYQGTVRTISLQEQGREVVAFETDRNGVTIADYWKDGNCVLSTRYPNEVASRNGAVSAHW